MAAVYRTNAAVVPRTGTEVRGPQARQLSPGGQRSAARCEPIHLVAMRLGYFRPMSHRLSDTFNSPAINSPAIARPDTGSACSATARNTANRFSGSTAPEWGCAPNIVTGNPAHTSPGEVSDWQYLIV